MKGLLYLCLVATAMCATPPRPNIANTFEARAIVSIRTEKIHHLNGLGGYAYDQSAGKGVEDFIFPGNFRVFELERFDLGKGYEIDSRNRSLCHEGKLPTTAPHPFEWLKTAHYDGSRRFGKVQVDVWNSTIPGGVHVAMGVFDTGTKAPTRPVFIAAEKTRKDGDREFRLLEILEWGTRTPPAAVFNVPKECQK